MSIKYRLQKNYGKLKEKAEFRAIIMERQTIGLERIGQNIQGAMSLTRADVFATVMALGDEIAYQLLDGNAVHLPGIGYFSLAVKGEVYEDPRTHNHRLRNPKVRTKSSAPIVKWRISSFLPNSRTKLIITAMPLFQQPKTSTKHSRNFSPQSLSLPLPTSAAISIFPLLLLIALLNDWRRQAESIILGHAD